MKADLRNQQRNTAEDSNVNSLPPFCSNRIQNKKSAQKRERGKLISDCSSKRKKTLSRSKDRWSAERYNWGQQKLLEIMKDKRAVVGNPMSLLALRQEARNHIRDTGLLDHLLKHTAGKVAPGGIERFRRRHNAEGIVEYWLESAVLVTTGKEAGVNDPNWLLPPGTVPAGDNRSHQHHVCTSELKLLKEEMAILKRKVQELLHEKKQQHCCS